MIETTTNQFLPQGYELLRQIWTGSNSEVWKVCALSSGLPYAWKRPTTRQPRDYALEAEACSATLSTAVPRLMRRLVGEYPSLLVEWLDGRTLADLIADDTRLAVGQVFWIGRQIAQALSELHRAGFGHGNLQPRHVFLESNGDVRLVGLGSAFHVGTTPVSRIEEIELADAECRSPEAFGNTSINATAADAYSLGVMLYRCLTGRLPFHGATIPELRRAHQQSIPPDVRDYCPYLPTEAEELVHALLSKQPLRRPHHPRDLLARLLDAELQTLTFRRIG